MGGGLCCDRDEEGGSQNYSVKVFAEGRHHRRLCVCYWLHNARNGLVPSRCSTSLHEDVVSSRDIFSDVEGQSSCSHQETVYRQFDRCANLNLIDMPPQIITATILELLGEYSHKNNYSRRIMGLYLYATGAQRQTISVMSHLGVSESYQSLTHKPRLVINRRRKRTPLFHDPPAPPFSTPSNAAPDTQTPFDPEILTKKLEALIYTKYGSLGELSMSMRSMARAVASTGLFAATYDNINMMFRAAEQVMGRTGIVLTLLASMHWLM